LRDVLEMGRRFHGLSVDCLTSGEVTRGGPRWSMPARTDGASYRKPRFKPNVRSTP
jgi:hypothetical protein